MLTHFFDSNYSCVCLFNRFTFILMNECVYPLEDEIVLLQFHHHLLCYEDFQHARKVKKYKSNS